ncbi:GlsB/YeaQ/YmgE family stress response membrane protein [Rhodococcus phenolicus]|uniref:GlsB/YeaQ/YmgE family stress response membrane protein n=1 Tax=Rhodococcus phenolicus TaxID=263849 RepID=UPI00082C398A|nr:GlsB/YeaQ/YmgE family stress response membrane protein [Rhodococcus phenolicus]
MLSLSIIAWIIIGGLAGWIGSKLMGTDAQQGILLNIVVGVIGGLLGGWIFGLFGVDVESGGWIFSFITCLVGACILLFLVKLVTGRSRV